MEPTKLVVTGAAADAMAVLEGRTGVPVVVIVATGEALPLRAPRTGTEGDGRKALTAVDRKRRLLSTATFIVVGLCGCLCGFVWCD